MKYENTKVFKYLLQPSLILYIKYINIIYKKYYKIDDLI